MPEPVVEIKFSALLSRLTKEARLIRLAVPQGTELLKVEPWSTFLLPRRSSRIFQDMNVLDILDIVFGSCARRGHVVPLWRFDIAEPMDYPKRSLTTQYQENDLAFAERLMREEGLIYFFEYNADAAGRSLGKQTMVIADHNCIPCPADSAIVGGSVTQS